jgi:hypothetical protein
MQIIHNETRGFSGLKKRSFIPIKGFVESLSGGELLELRLLDTRLLDTFGRKSIARHEIDKLLESS